ncbi:phosphate ABC transporter substrate-binding protein PstS [Salinibacterium sp.]|uniref:phosphate ABC transporter substrate-binding protein PstS n=1 Tax=Salinibacterium sp. TaxID=1915057 RepID=UPI00286CC73F|nr:phosphate ABC transporter substrate-binding protein PstS [Salinibacterium sp.]
MGDTYYPVAGAGSTWSANALQQWIRNVFDNYRWKVTFDDSGSSAGRQLFSQGTVDFGVSEIPYALAGSDSPDPRPARQFAYVPIVAGGTAFMYNLVIGGQRVTNLRLSGETLAKIFTGVITKWDDAAIAADNPKLTLPAITIVPVVRSDGSGTTAQLTSWMRAQYPSIWSAYCAKAGKANCGITSNYPIVQGSSFIGQQGSNGVSGLVAQSKSVGAITYVEASYALNARFPVAKVLNSAGYYTEPTASNVAVSLLAAVINNDANSPDYLTASLGGVYDNADARSYPLSSYSYMIIPTAVEGNFTENKGLTLADFASYFLCEGQQQAEVLGYSPLPVNLASAGLEQVQKIPGGNPQNKTIASCNNPTFSPDGSNKLAATAPQPQACDKKGGDQCLTGTGGAADTPTASSGGAAAAASAAGTAGAKPGATGAAGGAAGTSSPADPNGEATGLAAGGIAVVAGSPIDLPGKGLPVGTLMLMVMAVIVALAVVLLPPVYSRRRVAAMAGTPRGPTRRQAARLARRRSRAPWIKPIIPNVHLRVPFRKGGSAVPPMGGS